MTIAHKASTSLALIAAAVLLLTGCSVSTPQSGVTSDLKYTLKDNPLRGTTIVGTFQSDWGLPLTALNEAGDPEGIVYEVVAAAAKQLGAKLRLEPNDFTTTVPGVQSGKYDVGLGTDATVDRQKVVDIVGTYQASYRFVTVSTHADLPNSLKGFSGLKVAVPLGSHYEPVQEASAALEADGKPGIEILTFPDTGSMLAAVQSGRADATLRYTASALYDAKNNAGWKVSGPSLMVGASGFAVRKNSGLAELWRKAVDATIANGEYLRILKKYGVAGIALDSASVNPAK